VRSWAAAGADVPLVSTLLMCPDNGFLHVGEFSASFDHVSSEEIRANAPEVMYDAYALLQKADAVVCRKNASGHTRLVIGVHVVHNADGSIDPAASYAETLEQTRGFIRREHKSFDEKLGEDVYDICGNVKYTFANLYETGYMPITCRAFTDPAPIPAPEPEPEPSPINIYFKDSFPLRLSEYIGRACLTDVRIDEVTWSIEAGDTSNKVYLYFTGQVVGDNSFHSFYAAIYDEDGYIIEDFPVIILGRQGDKFRNHEEDIRLPNGTYYIDFYVD